MNVKLCRHDLLLSCSFNKNMMSSANRKYVSSSSLLFTPPVTLMSLTIISRHAEKSFGKIVSHCLKLFSNFTCSDHRSILVVQLGFSSLDNLMYCAVTFSFLEISALRSSRFYVYSFVYSFAHSIRCVRVNIGKKNWNYPSTCFPSTWFGFSPTA